MGSSSAGTVDQRKAFCLRVEELKKEMTTEKATDQAAEELLPKKKASSGQLSRWRAEFGMSPTGTVPNPTGAPSKYPLESKELFTSGVKNFREEGYSTKTSVEMYNKLNGSKFKTKQYYEWVKQLGQSLVLPVKTPPLDKQESHNVGCKTPITKTSQSLESISDFIDGLDSISEFELLREIFEAKATELANRLLGKK